MRRLRVCGRAGLRRYAISRGIGILFIGVVTMAELNKCVLLTKYFDDLPVQRMGEEILDMGFDGLLMTCREGTTVNCENAHTDLLPAIRTWNQMGLSTTGLFTDLTGPDSANCERIYEICGQEGINMVSVAGYYFEVNAGRYLQQLDKARRALGAFLPLSEKYDVRTVVQMHRGPLLHSRWSNSYLLLKDYDPQRMGLILDLGHLAVVYDC